MFIPPRPNEATGFVLLEIIVAVLVTAIMAIAMGRYQCWCCMQYESAQNCIKAVNKAVDAVEYFSAYGTLQESQADGITIEYAMAEELPVILPLLPVTSLTDVYMPGIIRVTWHAHADRDQTVVLYVSRRDYE